MSAQNQPHPPPVPPRPGNYQFGRIVKSSGCIIVAMPTPKTLSIAERWQETHWFLRRPKAARP